jgi:hypothetical protein
MGIWGSIKKGLGTVAGLAGTAIGGPIAGALIGYGASKLTGGGGGGSKGDEKRYKKSFDASIEAERGRGTRFSDEYEGRAFSYDPQENIERSVEGGYNLMMPQLLAGQVGRGNLRTGFGAIEQNEFLSNLLASRAMEGERYRFENMRDIGAYGERARDRVMDADFGRYATERQAREQAAASKRGLWGQLGGAAIGAAGRILANRI